MILEKFFTDKYDDWTVFVNPDMTFGEFKRYVAGQTKEFKKSEKENVVLLCENYFDFAVNFFAAVFARKNIHLLTDSQRYLFGAHNDSYRCLYLIISNN